MEKGDSLTMWKELEEFFSSDKSYQEKYAYYYGVLRRVCTQMVSSLVADYTDFFSRLQAVCRLTVYPLHDVDTFRWRARQICIGEIVPTEEMYLVDTKAFVEALAHFTKTTIPLSIRMRLPDKPMVSSIEHRIWTQRSKKRRFVALRKDDMYIYAVSRDMPLEESVKVDYNMNAQTVEAAKHVGAGMQFNAVSFTVDREGVVFPELIVLEPDFTLDITTVTGCMKAYGDSALNHLVAKFQDSPLTHYILLGNVANQFLDDCVNSGHTSYKDSIQKVFKDYLLEFSVCDGIDRAFFSECERQFCNIRSVVNELMNQYDSMNGKGNVVLEPSFFCETLGLQGRMDFLQCDYRRLIELKSGKWDEWNKKAQQEHLLQMVMYKEMLYYNIGVKQSNVNGFILYSKYPHLQEQRTARQMVQYFMTLRNEIVMLERSLREGRAQEIVALLFPESLRTRNGVSDSFWQTYCLPSLQKIIYPLKEMDELTSEYFFTFLRFVEREQYLAKVGDGRLESTRGMASLWNADLDAKIENGDILFDLEVVDVRRNDGVEALCLECRVAAEGAILPNFRVGDAVVLYERNTEDDSVVNKQVVRCIVESFDGAKLWLQLRYKQKNEKMFLADSLYAVEHDYIESSFRPLYVGLYSLLRTTERRRDLILCRKAPECDESRNLNGRYLNEQINDIVLKAKRAKDYFLLVGPPGTGKTSVALKSMVEEFLSEGDNVLLLSYTNRAVDEICAMLSTIDEELDYIRLGRELSCAKEFRAHLMNNVVGDSVKRADVVERLQSARVFVSTVASLSGHKALFRIKNFDVAIIDEASQILEPQILGLLCDVSEQEKGGECSIRKFIMVGDHKQLPAVVVQDGKRTGVDSPSLNAIGLTDCGNSLFERLYNINRCNENIVALLDHQGRMHPDISDFASALFYGGKLVPVPLPHQKEAVIYSDFSDGEDFVAQTRFGFIDIPLPSFAERQAKANVMEAEVIVDIVRQLMILAKKNGEKFVPAAQLGVIVPFRRQISVVRSLLERHGIEGAEDIVVDTVERYQGSQRDVIIYGTTITKGYELNILSNIVEADGVSIDRKLNVAVTRARKQLFVIGNKALLKRNPIYAKLIDYARCTEWDVNKDKH